jgi:hypothetical protein
MTRSADKLATTRRDALKGGVCAASLAALGTRAVVPVAMSCQATNAFGDGSGTATISYAPSTTANAPVVINTAFNLVTSGSGWVAGGVVGTMTAIGGSTSWSITAGNTSEYFAISNTGMITVTAAGVSGLGGQSGILSFTCQATTANGGGTGLAIISYDPESTTAPQVNIATFSLITAGASWFAGTPVGQMTPLNLPASWSITAGNASGYYAIDNSGNITVTAAGISALGNQTGTSTLICQATNAAGKQRNTVRITYGPTQFPTVATTGVPAGTTLTPSGSLTLSTAGQTISGLDITGSVLISASNVTMQNCRIYTPDVNATYGIQISDAFTGIVIKNCTIIGNGPGDKSKTNFYGIQSFYDSQVMIDGCNISYCGHDMVLSGGRITVQNCYCHSAIGNGDIHYEHIYYGGSSFPDTSILIQNNHFNNQNGWTAVVFMQSDFATITNVMVQNNLLAGGGYTVYVHVSKNLITNVGITGNAMVRGQYGYVYQPNAATTWSGNYDWISGRTVTSTGSVGATVPNR